jgi:hypothetical protein
LQAVDSSIALAANDEQARGQQGEQQEGGGVAMRLEGGLEGKVAGAWVVMMGAAVVLLAVAHG